MRGVKPLEKDIMDQCWWTPGQKHQPIPGAPFSESERKAVETLIAQGRVVMQECQCGQSHPVVTAKGKEARSLQDLIDRLVSET